MRMTAARAANPPSWRSPQRPQPHRACGLALAEPDLIGLDALHTLSPWAQSLARAQAVPLLTLLGHRMGDAILLPDAQQAPGCRCRWLSRTGGVGAGCRLGLGLGLGRRHHKHLARHTAPGLHVALGPGAGFGRELGCRQGWRRWLCGLRSKRPAVAVLAWRWLRTTACASTAALQQPLQLHLAWRGGRAQCLDLPGQWNPVRQWRGLLRLHRQPVLPAALRRQAQQGLLATRPGRRVLQGLQLQAMGLQHRQPRQAGRGGRLRPR